MQPSPDQSPDRNVTVVEAAAILGITPDAVRSRLRRGSLRRDEAPDGTTLVVLEDDDRDRPDASTSDRETAQTTAAYIGALKSQIEMLERTIAPPYTSRKKWEDRNITAKYYAPSHFLDEAPYICPGVPIGYAGAESATSRYK
jgi:hypothetical protein